MPETTTSGQDFRSRLTEHADARSGPDWLLDLKEAARERFEQVGFPSARLEEWKNTNVTAIARTPFAHGASVSASEAAMPAAPELDGILLLFRDGRPVDESTDASALPDGTFAGSLSSALASHPEVLRGLLSRDRTGPVRPFVELNTRFLDDGAMITVPDDTVIERPVHLVHLSGGTAEPTAAHPRTLVRVGRGARLSLVETYLGAEGQTYLSNAVTEIDVAENASIDHYRVQLEGSSGYHVSSTVTHQQRNSRVTVHNFDLGGKLVRNDLRAVLHGEGALCNLNGLYVIGGSQHVDNHTVLEHLAPHCDSRELYKGILGGRARSVFEGRIVVQRPAQKTDAKQSNPNLLLSAESLAYTRPQLEIYADDVRCTHGATIGRLDEEAIFYLRSRGIPENRARHLMVSAFAGEVLERCGIPSLRTWLTEFVESRLSSLEGTP